MAEPTRRGAKKIPMIDWGDKVPPQDLPLETFVLNRLINDPTCFMPIIQNLEEIDFYKPGHQEVFNVVMDLYKEYGRPINFVDVTSYMLKHGMDYGILMEINSAQSPISFTIHDNIRVMQDISAQRQLIAINTELMQNLWNPEMDWYDSCSNAVKRMEELGDKYAKSSGKFSSNINQTLEEIMTIMNGNKTPGLEMKFKKLKKLLKLIPNNLIFLAASPKVGKTRLLVAIIYEMITHNEDVSIQWFSGEDDKAHIIRLLLSYHTNIPESVMTGEERMLTGDEYDILKKASDYIASKDIEIIDEPMHVDKVSMMFGTFCSKRRGKLCIMLYDNFNIARDLITDQSGLEKENYVAAAFQRINTMNNKNGKTSFSIVVDHLSKEHIRKQSFEEGYRPRQEHLKGSNRKYEVATQILMLNRPSLYKDLVADERTKGCLSFNGKVYDREEVLNKLLIAEMVANRNGSMEESHALIRFTADLYNMEYTEWDETFEVLSTEDIPYEDRGITEVDKEMFNKEFWLQYPKGDYDACFIQLKYEMGKEDVFGNLITFDYVRNKYSRFVIAKKDLQNDKYTRKEDKIVDLCEFLQKKMYNQKFERLSTKKEETRDYYLYGLT
mgnify:CR=1 FL=1